VVLLNKMDMVSRAEREDLGALVREVNSSAILCACEHSRVDLSAVLHINAFSVTRALECDELFLSGATASGALAPALAPAAAPIKKAGSAAFAFATPPPNPSDPSGRAHLHAAFGSFGVEALHDLDELAFTDWLEQLFAYHGSRLYRVKGIAFFRTIDQPTSVQCVGSHIEFERMPPADFDPALVTSRRTRLVFIGRIEGLEQSLIESFRALT
jgi:G3E family GTPase